MYDTSDKELTNTPVRERIRTWKFWKPMAFTSLGGLGGFLYYYFIGCSSGTCPITSNPFISIAFGGIIGYLLVSK